jgi:DNA-binding SARP family transcriptional activator
MPTLHISLLGDFRLSLGDNTITSVTLPRVQSLLAYLVLHTDAPQNRSQLAFLLWPDSTEAQAHTNLRQVLFQLRQSLPKADRFLASDKLCVRWLPPSPEHTDGDDSGPTWTLDVRAFEAALTEAESAQEMHDPEANRRVLTRAVRLYRGDLLPGCYEEWILSERDRLRQEFPAGSRAPG